MSRCQHCNKLTHSEHLYVFYDIKDEEKINELTLLENWTSKFMYLPLDLTHSLPNEYGKLKCGDIYIHFTAKNE